jgi:hypothetical protein
MWNLNTNLPFSKEGYERLCQVHKTSIVMVSVLHKGWCHGTISGAFYKGKVFIFFKNWIGGKTKLSFYYLATATAFYNLEVLKLRIYTLINKKPPKKRKLAEKCN